MAAIVGVVTGVGALVFRVMISVIHNLFFLQTFSLTYDSSLFTPGNPWGAAVIFVPVIGGIIVTFIVSNFAPEAKGHGVPEVMDAIYYKGGAIRPVVAAVKSIASAVAIGTGAAVGREGPIIQIGSALGSTFGQILKLTSGPAHRSRGRGRRRRYRRNIQHSLGRRAVRHRIDAAGSECEHVPAGRHRDRRGDIFRPAVFRTGPGIFRARDDPLAQQPWRRRLHAAALHRPRHVHGHSGRGFHPRPASVGGCVRQDSAAATSGT